MNKTALITGISGQDGFYLTKHLLNKNYKVFGTIRRHSIPSTEAARLEEFKKDLTLVYADLTDMPSLGKALEISKPDEVYNLGAQSHVAISFTQPVYTTQTIVLGTLYLLELIRQFYPTTKFYQASSSEQFGNQVDEDGYQRETTQMKPVSPYATAKLAAYNLVRNYRESYKLFASNGILFNHESPFRGEHFVTKKVVVGAINILRGNQQELKMGPLDSKRDWGHAEDYTRAMHSILEHYMADDFICATGISHTIEDLCNYVFSKLGLDYTKHVISVPEFRRPEELRNLRGDATKLKASTGWVPKHTFENLLDEMIENELTKY